MAAGAIYMISASITGKPSDITKKSAGETMALVNNVNTLSVQQEKTSNPVISTNFTKEEQKGLLTEYKEQGIEQKSGILYYKNKPVRCFADIYKEKSNNKNGGITIKYKSVYSYFNENGVEDIYVERKSIKAGEKWPHGKIITQGQSLEDFVFVIPQECVNTMLDKSVRKDNYKDLELFIIHAGQKSIDNAAKQIAANGDYDILDNIIYMTGTKVTGEIAELLVEKGEYNALQDIICFIGSQDKKKVADLLYNKGAYDAFSDIAPALEGTIIDEYAKKFAEKGKYGVVSDIAVFVSGDVMEEIDKQAKENGKTSGLQYNEISDFF